MQIIYEGANQSDHIVKHWEENGNLFGVMVRPAAGERGRMAAEFAARTAEDCILYFLNGEYHGDIALAAAKIVETWQRNMRQRAEFAGFSGMPDMPQHDMGKSEFCEEAPLSVAVIAGCAGRLSLIYYGEGHIELRLENEETILRFPGEDNSARKLPGFVPNEKPIYTATFDGKLTKEKNGHAGGADIRQNNFSDIFHYFAQFVSDFLGFDAEPENVHDCNMFIVDDKPSKADSPEPAAVRSPTPAEQREQQKAKARKAQLSESLRGKTDELQKVQEKKRYWETQKENARLQYDRRLESIEKRRQYLDEKLASAKALPDTGEDALAGSFLPCVVFSHSEIGNSHVKLGMPCEDATAHFCDPDGRYAIAVLCDGHSDPQCFRSAKGAELGCRGAVTLLRRFLDAYFDEPEQNLFRDKALVIDRLRRAFITEWNRLVAEDLKANPLTEAELQPLDNPKYRTTLKIYREGRALNNIYGTTMVAAAVCGDLHIVMQVGDGAAVRLEYPGHYSSPLPDDAREGMVGPASLCDSDLNTRENAFRIDIVPGVPQAIFGMSDGIGEWPLSSELRERLRAVHEWLLTTGNNGSNTEAALSEATAEQREMLQRFVTAYTQQGVQDDCSLFGIICKEKEAAPVVFQKEEVMKLKQELEGYRAEALRQYETSLNNIRKAMEDIEKKYAVLQSEADGIQKVIDRITARFPNLASAETVPSPDAERDSGDTQFSLSAEQQTGMQAQDEPCGKGASASDEPDTRPERKEASTGERTEAE